MKRYIFLMLLVFFSFTEVAAQNKTIHNDIWHSVKMNYHHEKLTVGVEYQHRRQANEFTHELNVYSFKEADLFRVWLKYQLDKNWKLLYSPFSCTNRFHLIDENGELHKKKLYKTALGFKNNINLHKDLQVKNRFLYELQFVDKNHDLIHHYHYKLGLDYHFIHLMHHRDLVFHVADEVFVETNELRDTNFDHNRVYVGLGLENTHWYLDLYYKYAFYKPSEMLVGNSILISVTYDLNSIETH